MPRSCCVVGCQTGYKSNSNKIVSTFSFPKNESLRQKWINVIPRKDLIVTQNSAVCANHCTEDQIITKWSSGVGNNKVCINLKYPKLKEDAIPCLFPGPKYLSKPIKKRKSPTKRVNLMCAPTDSKKMKPLVDFNIVEQNTSGNELNSESIELLQDSNIPTNQNFENICSGIKSITLPDLSVNSKII
ncbi:uncharacterized protein LOC126554149 [Aphis gossypii]|uniref:uncharacterized protein LOC126554149 n=1 Tax=Aphis gossypii TaxID=80765 RepID=UPI0021597A44|nr:uncharacterized protein LOC126554149 [Aphis gossypii]